MNKDWTVWAGGTEVSYSLLTQDEAKDLAMEYIGGGYEIEDVQIENLSDDKNYQLINNKWREV